MLKKLRNYKGFSLIELLVATSVFLIVVVLSGQLIKLASFDSQVNTNLNEVQQNGRVALKFLERDITNSGDSFLIGAAGGQAVNGPAISIDAFKNIRGTNGKNSGNNVPNTGDNKQSLFCLLPVRRADNLGNGAASASPSQTAQENGSADRLTVAYKDQFFIAASEPTYATTAARSAAVAPPANPPSSSIDVEFEGVWTRPNGVNPAKITLTPKDIDTQDAMGNPIYIRRFFDVSNVRVGDIFKLTGGTSTQNEVLAIVSNINPGNSANYVTNPPSLEFATDVLGLNKSDSATVAAIKALSPASPTYATDRAALLPAIYPLDLMPEVPGDPIGTTVTATKVLVYTYLVDTTSKDLVRRRYTYGAVGTPIGNAMINDPVCQNVERFWVSVNLFIPANPPTTTSPSLGNDTELDPDANQPDYANLQNIRRVNISLILRSSEIDRRTRQPARFGIQTSYSPRNIVYQINENAS